MVINVETVQVVAKETGSLKDSSAVVVNGYFCRAKELNSVQVEVDKQSLGTGDKFKKVKLSFKSGSVKMAYLNLLVHGSPVAGKKLVADKYGKVKMSVTLPDDCVTGMEKFGQYIHSQLKAQVQGLGEARTLVYGDKNDEAHWVYVELDEKDKYLGATLNMEKFSLDKFHDLTANTADIALGAQVYLWLNETGSYDYSLKMKLVSVNTN